jgi:acyl-CoA thioesterase-1
LRAALPRREIHLTIRGARGLTATQMLTLIEQELKDKRFALVLWQTGAVEAAHGASVEELRATLDAGIVAVRGAGSELVLIDPQYSRFLSAKVNLTPYMDALKDAADAPDVALFRRNELMKFWVDDGRNDLERVKKADQEAAVDALHSCLGIVLAHFVANGAGVTMP